MPDMISVKIEDQQVVDHLKRLEKKAGDMSQVMRDISEDMLDAVLENFAKEGRPARWPELSPSYKKWLTKKGKTGKMLNRTAGGLYHSIAARADAMSAVVGTNKKYAAIHHFGGKIRVNPTTSTVRFRTDAKGNLLRQGKNGNLLVFAKGSHKRAVTRAAVHMGHTINMPARPYLMLTDADTRKIVERMKRYLEE